MIITIETVAIVLGSLTAICGLAAIYLSWDDIKFVFGRKDEVFHTSGT